MPFRPKRHPELNRLYAAVGLAVLIWFIVRAYKVLSLQVSAGVDAPSRWALPAVGLANTLAIATLLFIVARSLAKLYFERRKGILGARIRTRLVLALFGVCLAPSLMLFLIGRNFISKNVARWFLPETQQVIRDGARISEAFQAQQTQRLAEGLKRLPPEETAPLAELRGRAGLDLLARAGGGFDLAPGRVPPALPSLAPNASGQAETPDGVWLLQAGPRNGPGAGSIAGVLMPRPLLESATRLERRAEEAAQVHTGRESLETLPQDTFLLLTLLTLFTSVWVGLTLSRTISEPVRALAKAAQRVGTGDLEVQLPEEGEDELALLSRSFNTMTRDLRSQREAIHSQAERLERQRAYQVQLLEALPVGVLSWQRDGELRTCNPAARAWLGLEDWDPIACPWSELATQPRMGGLPSLVQAVREDRRARQEELRLGGEGEGRPVRAVVLPLQSGGELAVLEDLSLLAQAEKRAAWQEVARRMAHEVKNPLTPIKLTAQRLLRRSRDGRLDARSVAEGAETVLTEVESLSRLVDSFSRFAKLPSPQPRELDAGELLRQVHALYAHDHPGVAWELDVPPQALPARWDGDMVKRALINYVDNALGALEGRGRIRLGLRVAGERLRFEVDDAGPGIPEEQRARLFEPYFSTKRKGTGLGLAIARRIAQDHGGEAFFEPLPQGSRFGLELPARSAS